jgi:hypothetical protein
MFFIVRPIWVTQSEHRRGPEIVSMTFVEYSGNEEFEAVITSIPESNRLSKKGPVFQLDEKASE